MPTPINKEQLFSALKMIFLNRQMWLIGLIGCLLYLPSSVFLDLWGIPYLKSVYLLDQEQAANLTTYMFIGWIISGPIVGFISDKVRLRVLPLTVTGLFAAVLLCAIFYVPNLNADWLPYMFFLIGCGCGAHPLCFALGKENNPLQISGTAVAVTNMFIMSGGMLFQPIVGKLLDLHANGTLSADNLPIYSPADYTYALSVVPIGFTLGIFLSLFLKETRCRSQVTAKQESIFKSSLGLQPEAEAAN